MKKKILIVTGDPNSINSEIIYKSWKKINTSLKKRIYFIGSFDLIKKQFSKLRYKEKILEVKNLDEKINEKNLKKHLQTNGIPDPDILIRTGNTKRLSNFLLWQLAYAEIFFEKKLWPAFNEKDFCRIITEYKKIKRNFGKI